MKFLRKNQIILYSLVLMLMVAGYFNYTENVEKTSVETSIDIESKTDEKLADIGDATLVSSSDVITQKENSQQNKDEKKASENPKEKEVETNAKVDDYFVKTKLERDTMYSQMIETYEDISSGVNVTEEQKKEIVEKVSEINDIKNKIMISENLLETKGFINTVILINEKSINVIVKAKELKPEEVARIQNVISREMNSKIEDIHISKK